MYFAIFDGISHLSFLFLSFMYYETMIYFVDVTTFYYREEGII